MKFKFLLRLMTAIAFITSFASTTIDAGFFDNIKKMAGKAGKTLQKAAHGSIGQMALQVGGAAVSAKYGQEAGSMFSGAAQSMHLADQADAAADESDSKASDAEDNGDAQAAAHHKATAKTHRDTAAYHRDQHAKQKKAYEKAGGNFDDDYEEHVGSRIKAAAKKVAKNVEPEDEEDEEDDSDYAANDEGASDSDADDDEGADDENADDE